MIIATYNKQYKLSQNLIDSIFFKKIDLNVPSNIQRENLIKKVLDKFDTQNSIEKQL